jgi:hypothetical protein
MLVFAACFLAAVLLAMGFAIALCRGTRKERRERTELSGA